MPSLNFDHEQTDDVFKEHQIPFFSPVPKNELFAYTVLSGFYPEFDTLRLGITFAVKGDEANKGEPYEIYVFNTKDERHLSPISSSIFQHRINISGSYLSHFFYAHPSIPEQFTTQRDREFAFEGHKVTLGGTFWIKVVKVFFDLIHPESNVEDASQIPLPLLPYLSTIPDSKMIGGRRFVYVSLKLLRAFLAYTPFYVGHGWISGDSPRERLDNLRDYCQKVRNLETQNHMLPSHFLNIFEENLKNIGEYQDILNTFKDITSSFPAEANITFRAVYDKISKQENKEYKGTLQYILFSAYKTHVNVRVYSTALNNIVYGTRETGDFRRYSCDQFPSEEEQYEPAPKRSRQ